MLFGNAAQSDIPLAACLPACLPACLRACIFERHRATHPTNQVGNRKFASRRQAEINDSVVALIFATAEKEAWNSRFSAPAPPFLFESITRLEREGCLLRDNDIQ